MRSKILMAVIAAGGMTVAMGLAGCSNDGGHMDNDSRGTMSTPMSTPSGTTPDSMNGGAMDHGGGGSTGSGSAGTNSGAMGPK